MTMIYRVTGASGALSRWFETKAQAQGFLTKSFVANADPALQPIIEAAEASGYHDATGPIPTNNFEWNGDRLLWQISGVTGDLDSQIRFAVIYRWSAFGGSDMLGHQIETGLVAGRGFWRAA